VWNKWLDKFLMRISHIFRWSSKCLLLIRLRCSLPCSLAPFTEYYPEAFNLARTHTPSQIRFNVSNIAVPSTLKPTKILSFLSRSQLKFCMCFLLPHACAMYRISQSSRLYYPFKIHYPNHFRETCFHFTLFRFLSFFRSVSGPLFSPESSRFRCITSTLEW
jgi:hypothetical protein